MKKTIFTLSLMVLVLTANAQQQKGKVTYEKTEKMEFQMMGILADEGAAPVAASPVTHSNTVKLEVLFGNGKSLRRMVADDEIQDGLANEWHTTARMSTGDVADLIYTDFSNNQVVSQQELGPKNFVVTDNVAKLNWKLTGATMTILNYPCQQALAQRVGKKTLTSVENGQLKNREVADTAQITAWFTNTIPVPAGPEFQGQLPGLILAIDINNGATVYKAVNVSPDVNLTTIKEPAKGKKVTAAEFKKIQDKMLGEMQLNMAPARAIQM